MERIPHPSLDDRRARGKAARKQVPTSSHAGWAPNASRPDPVALLEEQNATREADLVPVRHGRMMVSPFTFYRGAAKIMSADLEDTPTAGLDVQLCGDAHISNFGVFASPERTLVFDLNDFAEMRTMDIWYRAYRNKTRASTGCARHCRCSPSSHSSRCSSVDGSRLNSRPRGPRSKTRCRDWLLAHT